MKQFEAAPDELNKNLHPHPSPQGAHRARHVPGVRDEDEDSLPTDPSGAPQQVAPVASDADGAAPVDADAGAPAEPGADDVVVAQADAGGSGGGAGAGAAGVDAAGAGGGSGAAGAAGAAGAGAGAGAGAAAAAGGAATAGAAGAGALSAGTLGAIGGGAVGVGVIVAASNDSGGSGTPTPTATISGIHISADTGATSTDFITATAAQTVTAQLSAALATGEHLYASVDGVTFVDITANVTGTNVSWTTALLDGTHNLQFEVRNGGNHGPVATQAYTLDESISAAGALTQHLTTDTDTGLSHTDAITNLVRPTVAVGFDASKSAVGDVIEIKLDGTVVGSVTLTADDITAGVANVALTADLAEGVNSLTTTQTDVAGNSVTATAPLLVTVDTTPMATVGGDLSHAPASDTGSSHTDHITSNATPTVTVTFDSATAQVGDQVSLIENGAVIGSIALTADMVSAGSADVPVTTALGEGANAVTIAYTDAAGNVTHAADPINVTLDTGTAAPVVHLADDTGSSSTDGISSVGTLSVTGVETGAAVQYSTDGGTTWVSSFTAIEGVNDVLVRVTDTAGNQAQTAYSFTLDTTAPPAPGELSVPEASAGVNEVETASDGGVPVIVPFGSAVVEGDTITLTVDDPTSNQPITISYLVTAGDVAAGHASVTIPTADVGTSGVYTVTAAVTDLAGNTGDSASVGFTVLPALVAGDDCTVFGFARREYTPVDPSTTAPAGSDVYLVTHGMTQPVDELTIYQSAYDLYTGTDLAAPTVTTQVGAGGIAVNLAGSEAGHDVVVGAAAYASASPNGAFVTNQTNTIINDTISLTINSTDTAKGSLYELADASSGGAIAQAGAHVFSEDVTAVGTATAGGAIVARAESSAEAGPAVANVQLCDVDIVAHGSADEGHIGAAAGLGVQTSQLGIVAVGTSHSASAAIAADAIGAATVSITIAEHVQVAAFSAGSGTASAYIRQIGAGADGGSSHAMANVTIGGDITIHSESEGGNALATLGGQNPGFTAYVSGSNGQAFVQVAGNVDISAQGDLNAMALMGGMDAANAGLDGNAATFVQGSITLQAQAADQAQAYEGPLTAYEHGESGQAIVAIGGDLVAEASASTANAAVAGIHANAVGSTAADELHEAGIITGGAITITAIGENQAHAAFSQVSVETHGDHAQGNVDIGVGFFGGGDSPHDISVMASASQGTATAHIGDVKTTVNGVDSGAGITFNGSLVADATGPQGAHADLVTLEAYVSSGSASLANIDIGGDVSIHAHATDGAATASVGGVNAYAGGLLSTARIDIAGDVRVAAEGGAAANAHIGSLGATASSSTTGSGSTIPRDHSNAALTIGGDVAVSAIGSSAVASVGSMYAGAASADDVGSFMLHNLTISAHGGSAADAKLDTIYVKAEATDAQASLSIDGDLSIQATADIGNATAEFDHLRFGAFGTDSAARLHVDGNLLVEAHAASGSANANMGASLYASATALGALADVSVGGDITVLADGYGHANANLDSLYSEVRDGSNANLNVGGDGTGAVHIGADSVNASAQAAIHSVGAYATNAGEAHLSIGNGFELSAVGAAGAQASMSTLEAQVTFADDGTPAGGAIASLSVNGDFSISALNHGTLGGGASASLGTIEVLSKLNDGVATVTIGNDLHVHAELDHTTGSYAEASIGSMSIEARATNSVARLSIGGDMVVDALAHGSGSFGVSASVEEIGIEASGLSSIAGMSVGGDLRFEASALQDTLGNEAMHDVRVSAEISSISVEARADHASAYLTIGGNLEVLAFGNGDNGAVSASLGTLSADASGVSATARIEITGGVNVWADAGSGASVFATAEMSGLTADAQGLNSRAIASVGTDIIVGARGIGDGATVNASMDSLSAQASQGGNASISIGGNVAVTASVQGVGSIADASFDGVSAVAQAASQAVVTIGGGVSVIADAQGASSHAKATINQLSAAARSGDSLGSLEIGDDVVVSAIGGADANVLLDRFFVEAGSNGDVARMKLDGDLVMSAFGDHAAALLRQESDNGPFHSDLPGIQVHSGVGGIASFDLLGSLTIQATGVSVATAAMDGIRVDAAADSTARITIGGDILVEAKTTPNESGGAAHASIGQFSNYSTVNWQSTGVPTRHFGGIVIDTVNGNAQGHIGGSVGVHATGSTAATAALYSIAAHASGGTASLDIAGGVQLHANASSGDAAAYLYHVEAGAGSTDPATLTIHGDVDVSAAGSGDVHVFGGVYAALGQDGNATVQGSIDLTAHAGNNVDLQAAFFADDSGNLTVHDVNVQVTSDAGDSDSADDLLLEIGAYDNAHVNMGELNVTLNGAGAEGKIFIGADSDLAGLPDGYNYSGFEQGHDSGSKYFTGDGSGTNGDNENVDVGPLDINTGAGASMTVWTDHVAWATDNVATFHGGGDVNFLASDPAYAVLDLTQMTGSFHYAEMTATPASEQANLGTHASDFNFTVIEGFDVTKDQIGFGNVTASVGTWRDLVDVNGSKQDLDGINYGISSTQYSVIGSSQTANAGTATSEAALFAALNNALDTSHDVAYAKYDGSLALTTGVNITNDNLHDWYAVAYDGDGTGITSLVFVEVAQGAVFGNVDISTVPVGPI